MKKLVFPLLVAFAAVVSFQSCAPEAEDMSVVLKNNIVKIQKYSGKDSDNDSWTASFTATTFEASGLVNITGSSWSVVSQDGKTGTITIKGIKNDKGQSTNDVTGTVSNKGEKMSLKFNEVTINLEKLK